MFFDSAIRFTGLGTDSEAATDAPAAKLRGKLVVVAQQEGRALGRIAQIRQVALRNVALGAPIGAAVKSAFAADAQQNQAPLKVEVARIPRVVSTAKKMTAGTKIVPLAVAEKFTEQHPAVAQAAVSELERGTGPAARETLRAAILGARFYRPAGVEFGVRSGFQGLGRAAKEVAKRIVASKNVSPKVAARAAVGAARFAKKRACANFFAITF